MPPPKKKKECKKYYQISKPHRVTPGAVPSAPKITPSKFNSLSKASQRGIRLSLPIPSKSCFFFCIHQRRTQTAKDETRTCASKIMTSVRTPNTKCICFLPGLSDFYLFLLRRHPKTLFFQGG